MSTRGEGGARGRGRGVGRGRERGRGKTTIWTWETYRPGPEVYNQLWRIRQLPAMVTPDVSDVCPCVNARSRILERRQRTAIDPRDFYIVEVIYFGLNNDDPADETLEVYEIDQWAILGFVSPAELERYENEQFKIEAEAEVVVHHAETQETMRRRLMRNWTTTSESRGSRMLSGLGLGDSAPTRGRGRSRGRRGRGSGRGRGLSLTQQRLGLVEDMPRDDGGLARMEEETARVVPETESEDEIEDEDIKTSPGLMRSAFITNSALPVSPMQRRSAVLPTNMYSQDQMEQSLDDITEVSRASRRNRQAHLSTPPAVRGQSEVPGIDDNALPVSPVQRRPSKMEQSLHDIIEFSNKLNNTSRHDRQGRRFTALAARGHPEIPDIDADDEDIDTGGHDARSMSSAAMQLRNEDELGGRVIENSEEEESDSTLDAGVEDHQRQRRRTDSVSIVPDSQPIFASNVVIPEEAFRQTPLFLNRSSAIESSPYATDDAIPEEAFRQTPLFQDRSSVLQTSSESDDSVQLPPSADRYTDSQTPDDLNSHEVDTSNGDTIQVQPHTTDDDDADEYVIEVIINHYKENGTRYYLVKWEGYEDSHDWLREEDLAGAQELLQEYNKKIREKERNDYSDEYHSSYSKR